MKCLKMQSKGTKSDGFHKAICKAIRNSMSRKPYIIKVIFAFYII